MPGLLIDRKLLLKYKLGEIVKFTPKNNANDVGIIFLIPEKQYTQITNLSDGDKKLSYINSKSFINSIYASYNVIYNKNKRICEIRGNIKDPKHLKDVLKSILVYLPNDVVVWTGIIPTYNCSQYIKMGFDNPYVVHKSPLDHDFNKIGLAFSKSNTDTRQVDESTVFNKLRYTIQDSGDICNIHVRFTPKTISYLKKINHPSAKKELSGALSVSKVIDKKGKLVFELSPDPGSVQTGAEEEVDAVWSRYNFHTHPKKAYDNHGVTRGWPSSQDYAGFSQLNDHTIFHTVVTLEGIYVISISPEWGGNMKDIDKKYVQKHYDIDHLEKISFGEYVKRINGKKYKKTGKQLFIVKYMPWNNATREFSIYYNKTKDKCLATEHTFKMSR